MASQSSAAARSTDAQLEAVHAWIVDHIDEELTIELLANRLKMAPRTFARKFVDRYGRTPAKLIEDLRLETACRHLTENEAPIKQIAHLCGFGDEERMRRLFMRRLRTSPAGYRKQYGMLK